MVLRAVLGEGFAKETALLAVCLITWCELNGQSEENVHERYGTTNVFKIPYSCVQTGGKKTKSSSEEEA